VSICIMRGCASTMAGDGGVCEVCWQEAARDLAGIPKLWTDGHACLPPGSRAIGLAQPHRSRTTAGQSPVSDFALSTLEETMMGLDFWALVVLRRRGIVKAPRRRSKRWGVVLSDAVVTLTEHAGELRGTSLESDYARDVAGISRRLVLLCGLDTLIHKLPAPCGRCGRCGLVRHNGREQIVCTSCGAVWGELEYGQHVKILARQYRFAGLARAGKGDPADAQ
jgi:hypothetical protein